ncbi:hypothetical protein GCM10008969_56350 [Pseudomonas veronii subsp. inensis]
MGLLFDQCLIQVKTLAGIVLVALGLDSLRGWLKKKRIEIRQTPYPWGQWVQAFARNRYYLTEEDLCSVWRR